MKPEVSVLMPVYNGEPFLRQAIDSILGQSFKNFEFIIIDDGSSDRSWEIIQSYSDPRIVSVRKPCNQGLARTLNAGIKLAAGSFIARMDCDDIAAPQRLAEQIAFLTANPGITVCGTWVELFGAQTGIWKTPLDHDNIAAMHLFGTSMAHPSVVMRKNELISNDLLYDENLERSQDYELWVRLSNTHRLANLGKVLLKYRLHDRSLSSSYRHDQQTVADRIRRDQLLMLGVEFNEDERCLHSEFSRGVVEPTYRYLVAAENWLLKIIKANLHTALFAQAAIENEISLRWWQLCRQSTSIGPAAYWKFHRSPLSRPSVIGLRQRLVFFIKCTLKYVKPHI